MKPTHLPTGRAPTQKARDTEHNTEVVALGQLEGTHHPKSDPRKPQILTPFIL